MSDTLETKNTEDIVRYYGQWPGNRKGVAENPKNCVKSIFRSSWWDNQCKRRRGYGSEGLFCWQHARHHGT